MEKKGRFDHLEELLDESFWNSDFFNDDKEQDPEEASVERYVWDKLTDAAYSLEDAIEYLKTDPYTKSYPDKYAKRIEEITKVCNDLKKLYE